MRRTNPIRSTTLILGVAALAACAPKSDTATTDTTGSASAGAVAAGASGTTPTTSDSAMGAMGTNTGAMSGNMSSGTAMKMTDAQILAMIAAANKGEVDAGKVAETKATNADVHAFAHEMAQAHAAMLAKGKALAGRIGGASGAMSAADSINNANKMMGDKLKAATKGAGFDKQYVDAQVAGHEATLAFLQQAQGQAQNAELKTMITGAIPDVQKHLDQVRALQGKVQ